MSNFSKGLLAYVLTSILVRVGYWQFKFTPTRDLSFWPGLLVDFIIWLVVFYSFYWGVGKIQKVKTTSE